MLVPGLPILVQPVSAYPQSAGMQPGQSYAGVIREQGNGLVVVAGKFLLPIPTGAGLTAGQRVTVELRAATEGPQLVVRPEGAAPAPSAPGSLDALLPLLESLGRLELAPRIAAALPRQLPRNSTSLQPLVQLLLSSEGLASDLDRLFALLAAARDSGALPPGVEAAVNHLLGGAPDDSPDSWLALLRNARDTRQTAARIAAGLKAGTLPDQIALLKDTPAALVRRLLSDPDFGRWLDERGEGDNFKSLGQRILDRASGAELQNLRQLDHAYQFLDLQVPESAGFQRAHVHHFADHGGRGRGHAGAASQTVLDLELSQLGALWISVQAAAGDCACRFEVEDADVADLIEGAAEELRTALCDAGYARVNISTTLWDGDRARALLATLAPFQGLDLEI